MSIEEKLRMEYKRKSRALSVPKEPAAEVMAAFRELSQDSKSGRQHSGSEKSAHRRTAFWLTAILLLSGFAYGGGKLLFQNQLGLWSLQLFSGGEDMLLDEAVSEEIWSSLQNVKRQLQPGEAAMVYFAALAESVHPLYRNYPLFGIKEPLWLHESHAQVVSRMRKDGLRVSVPQTLPEQYAFDDAFRGEPLSANAGLEGLQIIKRLRDETDVSGKRVAWMRMKEKEPASSLYTLTYVNEQGDTLLVTVEALAEQRVDQKWVVPNSTQVEELNMGGNKASYTSGEDVPFSASRYYQELSWSIIDPSHANRQYIYRVGSESKGIGKAELLRLAESFVNPHAELRQAA
ncbi:hypothetical protein [Paenibacillus sp. NPDC057967]|uniref:hypothetical protein n=1 Tax=Paenibacillus sp. NPDC057967 TaxID=3346293 RepID=UPI0036DF6DAA